MTIQDEKKSTIGQRLRIARELAGLTQGQVAKMIDMHRPSISEMEADRRKVSSEELTTLAEIYGVSVSWLVGENIDGADAIDDRVKLAARELSKLKPEDLDKLLTLIKALRKENR